MAFFNEVQTYLKDRTDNDAMNVYLKPLGAIAGASAASIDVVHAERDGKAR